MERKRPVAGPSGSMAQRPRRRSGRRAAGRSEGTGADGDAGRNDFDQGDPDQGDPDQGDPDQASTQRAGRQTDRLAAWLPMSDAGADDLTARLTRALFEEWARTGYARLSLEAVARRAGCSRGAIGRRWPSKAAMVVERLESLGLELVMAPDTGSLQGDLRAVLQVLRRLMRHPLVRRILPDLHAELQRSPALSSALAERLRASGRMRAASLVRRAVARGELDPGIDPELVSDGLCGMLYWRLIAGGGRADGATLDMLAGFIAAGLRAVAPPGRRPQRRRRIR